ncbi:MAG: histidine kinase dimerization/phospho-acceptor domain-containing protein, partial [bacterium]
MIFTRARTRLMVTNVLVIVLLLLVLGGGIVIALDRFLIAQESSTLNNEAQQSVLEFGELSESGFRERHAAYSAGTFYVVWDQAGVPIFNPANVDVQALKPAAMAALRGQSSTQTIRLSGNQDALVSSQLLVEDNNAIGAVQVGRSLAPLRQVENEVVLLVVLVGACVLLLSVGAGWFLAGRALVPIRHALERQKSFTADASHELRTPLTVIDTGIQMLGRHPERMISEYQEIVTSMQEESRRMNRLVSSLLELARADSGDAALQLTEIDASELLLGVLTDLE